MECRGLAFVCLPVQTWDGNPSNSCQLSFLSAHWHPSLDPPASLSCHESWCCSSSSCAAPHADHHNAPITCFVSCTRVNMCLNYRLKQQQPLACFGHQSLSIKTTKATNQIGLFKMISQKDLKWCAPDEMESSQLFFYDSLTSFLFHVVFTLSEVST